MKGKDHDRLLELGMRRKLTPREEQELESCFASHPDPSLVLEEELRLNQLFRNLPSVPVSNNFTARVMQAAAAQARANEARRRPRWTWSLPSFQWLKGTALAMLLVTAGLISYYQYQVSVRVERAHSVATVSSVVSIPTLEMLQDFDAIHRLSEAPEEADWELLFTALR